MFDIADYTSQRFGDEQSLHYRDRIVDAMYLLLDNPLMGSNQDTLGEGVRRFVRKSHAIYYEAFADEILILRVLGPGQDPKHEFS